MKSMIPIVMMAAVCGAQCATVDAARCGMVVVTDYVAADGRTDVSEALQKLIESHPNRTLYFPDGTYLLSRPIATPAEPTRSVDLQLSNYAVLKADTAWTNEEAMVRLGGIYPANNIRAVGSCYSLTGGVIDGSGVAKGVSIDSGRETKIQNVSMKNVVVGLHIKHGANGNSSDCDILDVNIVGNGATNSIGVFIESCDNTLSNMRITGVLIGVKLTGGGNLMRNLHPLFAASYAPLRQAYDDSIGFLDLASNRYTFCYSDHFSTGFVLGGGSSILDGCIVWWYGSPELGKGRKRTGIRCLKKFGARVTNLEIGFKGTLALNTVLDVKEEGGKGFLINPMINEKLVNETTKSYLKYLR
ncbi:MAG: hypothetical protein IJR99_09625 [Kiritimatiellae bacterium]|nr:hypothetical protein [Kiritimatiellia bacterium]